MNVAKKIVRTPDLFGEDAKRFLDMHSDTAISEERHNLLKRCVEVFRQNK